MHERRRYRSTDPTEALSLFLQAERRRLGIRSVTVSTEKGGLIAGSGVGLEALASAGASKGSPADLSESLATWTLNVGEGQVLLTSLGRKFSASLGEGVRRILLEASSKPQNDG